MPVHHTGVERSKPMHRSPVRRPVDTTSQQSYAASHLSTPCCGEEMPSIDIQVLENVFSSQEKAQIIKRVTEAFGEVSGPAIQAGTSVRIHEVQSGS